MEFKKYLKELEREMSRGIEFSTGSFAIFGSGPLAIRGMRDAQDIDIIVKGGLYEKILKKYPKSIVKKPFERLVIGNLEIRKTWIDNSGKVDEKIDRADIIKGLPYVKLEDIISWKEEMRREKDLNDIKLIKKYLLSEKK